MKTFQARKLQFLSVYSDKGLIMVPLWIYHGSLFIKGHKKLYNDTLFFINLLTHSGVLTKAFNL